MLRYPTVHLVERLPTISLHSNMPKRVCRFGLQEENIDRNHPQKNNLHLFPMDWVQGCMGMTEKCNNTT